jgi:hypothetical protein
MSDPNGPILIGFLLYGIFGAAGQIIRAVTALGGSQTLASGSANQQSLFNAAYFLVTLIIGFVAGLLAGLVAFDTITQTTTWVVTAGTGPEAMAASSLETRFSTSLTRCLAAASARPTSGAPDRAAA